MKKYLFKFLIFSSLLITSTDLKAQYWGGEQDPSEETLTFYRDADGDGWGDNTVTQQSSMAVDGYVLQGGDHDDNCYNTANSSDQCNSGGDDDDDGGELDPVEVTQKRYYRDYDGDGWGDSNDIQYSSTPLTGYVLRPGDHDDYCYNTANSPYQCNTPPPVYYTYYRDNDGDGWGNSGQSTQFSVPPSGWVLSGGDYNDDCYNPDNDPQQCQVQLTTYYRDADGDGWGDSADSQQFSSPQSGWVTNADDYNDDCNNTANDQDQCSSCETNINSSAAAPASKWQKITMATVASSSCEAPPKFINFNKQQIINEINERIGNPEKIDQNGTGLCGMAILAKYLAQHEPQVYKQLILDLYQHGVATKMNPWFTINTNSGLQSTDPSSNDYPYDYTGKKMAQADFILLASLKNTHNNFLNYDPANWNNLLSGATGPDGLESLMENFLGLTVTNNTNIITSAGDYTKLHDLSHYDAVGQTVFMFINDNMLYNTPNSPYPNHWVQFVAGPSIDVINETVSFQVYSWGAIKQYTMSFEAFHDNYYGYVLGIK